VSRENPPAELTSAIAALWQGPPLDTGRAPSSPLFDKLVAVCVQLFPQAVGTSGKAGAPDIQGVSWALVNALRATGTPWATENGVVPLPPAPEKVSAAIVEAMLATETQLIHLCPLDQADEWPELRFGPCEVRRFGRDQLSALLQSTRLRRHYSNHGFDVEGLSRFSWLVVRESRRLTQPVGSRALPFFYQTLDQPFGAIKPHTRMWPEVVERAVFALLMMPWESMTEYRAIEWRGFRVPWTYTVNTDPFARPALPLRSDSLSWEPDIFDDPNTGEMIELERPVILPLSIDAGQQFSAIGDQRWEAIETALASKIFNALVVHFFVHAFSSEGIDEFLAHIIAIEAALGMVRDHDRRTRPRINGKDISATKRIAHRIAALTGERAKADSFNRLFKLRSDFVHGKSVDLILPIERMMARSLTREVISRLVDAAIAEAGVGREQYLERLCP
jgi:hypothetical protein